MPCPRPEPEEGATAEERNAAEVPAALDGAVPRRGAAVPELRGGPPRKSALGGARGQLADASKASLDCLA